jgi:hypothetical protein
MAAGRTDFVIVNDDEEQLEEESLFTGKRKWDASGDVSIDASH